MIQFGLSYNPIVESIQSSLNIVVLFLFEMRLVLYYEHVPLVKILSNSSNRYSLHTIKAIWQYLRRDDQVLGQSFISAVSILFQATPKAIHDDEKEDGENDNNIFTPTTITSIMASKSNSLTRLLECVRILDELVEKDYVTINQLDSIERRDYRDYALKSHYYISWEQCILENVEHDLDALFSKTLHSTFVCELQQLLEQWFANEICANPLLDD